MEICVIGTGYVGLVAGTCFAETGNDVVCVDIDAKKIESLNQGVIPIFEPELEDLVKKNHEEGRLTFTTELAEAVRRSRVIFIAVGTPQDHDGRADLRYVLQVAAQIGEAMESGDDRFLPKTVVDKSTVPVGTADKVRETIAAKTKKPFHVVSNPEFMKEGAAVIDFLKPDRVVIGSDDTATAELMTELYAPFVRNENPILVMDVRSAEMTKYAANAMLATKISFMNEVASLCELVGADVNMVRKGIGHDKRIGFQFIFPGIGYGGSCFPKDVKALIRTGEEYGHAMQIAQSVDTVNDAQKSWLVRKTKQVFGNDLHGRVFALWGLSFKPQTDDMREAPSMVTIDGLMRAGAKVRATDPAALENAEKELAAAVASGDVKLFKNYYDALDGVDALLICTEWNEYRRPNFERMAELMKTPVIIDGRNLFKADFIQKTPFSYYSVGRPDVTARKD